MFNASKIIGFPEKEFPYNPIGDTIYIVKSGPGFVKFCTKKGKKASGHWLLEKLGANRYYSLIQLYNCPEPDTIPRFFTLGELQTLLDLPRDLDSTQRRYARRVGADVAKKGLFARNGKKGAVPNPGTGEEGDAVLYFATKPSVKSAGRRLIAGPVISGRHGGRQASKVKPGTFV